MISPVILAAAGLFFLHLIFETLATFVKYNFSSLGRHMVGISVSNILAMISRGLVALFGIAMAIVIESGVSDIDVYVVLFSVSSALAAAASLALSNLKIFEAASSRLGGTGDADSTWSRLKLGNNNEKSLVPIRGLVAVALGTQFVSIVIAYGVCFVLPERRLFVISLVPLISALGALVTILWVEPRLARMIDDDNRKGYAASREFLRARAVSFLFSSGLLILLPWVVPKSWL
jgi:hypothetical protein